jgi:hypothetical protein
METEKIQKEYRDYTCIGVNATCNYTVTNTSWTCTGNTRVKQDVTGPTTYNLNAKMKNNLLNITATVKDACSSVSGAEYFFDVCPSVNVRGSSLLASDGSFGESTENVYKNFINYSPSDGTHRIYVRGKDDKGNWGPCASKICYVWKWSSPGSCIF